MSAHTVPVPAIVDAWRRAARTAVQAATAVFTAALALGAVYQMLVPVIGAPTRATLLPWLIAAAVAVGSNAALLARLMAIPAVNALCARVGLGGQSTVAAPLDTETRMIALQAANAN